ncbi:MAG: hypothetical protein E7359_02480 [Clostridiales bacterium]|nr:hypothetical protein [Clostridiales bacterium]
MLTIHGIMKDIYEQPEECRLNFALNKYLKFFNEDVIKYFLKAHCSQYHLFDEFDNINIEKTLIKLITVSSDDIFNKIDYANFCSFRNETEKAFDLLNSTGYNYWPFCVFLILIQKD